MNAYSKAELSEFKSIILNKLQESQLEYDSILLQLQESRDGNKETASETDAEAEISMREELKVHAQRIKKFIDGLQAALLRISNGTYGICRITGSIIPKERLMAVPHTTLSIGAKTGKA